MRRSVRLATLLSLGVTAVVVVVVVLTTGPKPYTGRAEFANADGLQSNFSVRIQGVVVGHVVNVSVTPRFTAMVTFALDQSAAPIGSGAQASIHPSNLLGEKYISLDRGDVAHPLPSGSVIPISRTSTAPELDQLLNTFSTDTRTATAVFLTEQGNALLGRGHDLAGTLARLPSSLQSAQQLLDGLSQDNVVLGHLITDSDRVLASVAPQRAALGRLVQSAQGAFQTLASREQGLGQTIVNAPAAVSQLQTSLLAIEQAAPSLGQGAIALRRIAPPLAQALDQLPGFANAATPALTQLQTAAPALQRLGDAAAPVLHLLQPTAARMSTFSRTLAPVSALLDQQIANFLAVIQGWARAIGDRDGIGHIYRIQALLPNDTLPSIISLLTGGGGGSSGTTPAPAGGALRSRRPSGLVAPASAPSPRTDSVTGRAGNGSPTSSAGASPSAAPLAPLSNLLDYLVKP